MKIILNPAYDHLRSFVENIPVTFDQGGTILQDKRNTIKVFDVGGIAINVKRYRVPIWINRIVYTFFRKTKASKAYFNALEVIRRGFLTPESIAYIETYKNGLLATSYYISLQCPYRREIRELYFGPLRGNETLLADFARYTAALHDAGIYHLDYSPGNILIGEEAGKYIFSLVDINRMQFKKIDLDAGCHNLERLFDDPEIYTFIAQAYAKARGFRVEECIRLMQCHYQHYIHRLNRKKRWKHRLHKK